MPSSYYISKTLIICIFMLQALAMAGGHLSIYRQT